ncbi:hypothetical protein ABZ667_26610 [Streptomyces lavendulae]|uniref:hypothetical protein n=1 Tax=Streptomyces lavendulae TaxID=1914 RepID=UPI0033C0E599
MDVRRRRPGTGPPVPPRRRRYLVQGEVPTLRAVLRTRSALWAVSLAMFRVQLDFYALNLAVPNMAGVLRGVLALLEDTADPAAAETRADPAHPGTAGRPRAR